MCDPPFFLKTQKTNTKKVPLDFISPTRVSPMSETCHTCLIRKTYNPDTGEMEGINQTKITKFASENIENTDFTRFHLFYIYVLN